MSDTFFLTLRYIFYRLKAKIMEVNGGEGNPNLGQQNVNHRVQNVREEWFQQNPDWREIFIPDPNNPTRIRCIRCYPMAMYQQFNNRNTMLARLETINRHTATQKHRRNVGNPQQLQLDRKVAIATLKLSVVFAEHNLAFLLANHLVKVIKDISDDPDCREIWRRLTLDRFKVKEVLQDCIAHSFKEHLSNEIRPELVSLQLDESTNCSNIGVTSILIKYIDFSQRRIINSLWNMKRTLEEAGDQDANAESIMNLLEDSLAEYNVPIASVAVFTSDGCNTMFGEHNSVVSRFRAMNEDIICVKCPAHIVHLCSEHAISFLPVNLPQFCKQIHAHFSRSPRRSAILEEFQAFFNFEIQKMLKPGDTRWLSLEAGVDRIIEQWIVLLHYFLEQQLNAPNDATIAQLIEILNSDKYHTYFHFLNFILPQINVVNKFFQKREIIVHKIDRVLTNFFKSIACLFLNRVYVMQTSIENIDVDLQTQFVGLENINLGPAANQMIINLSNEEDNEVRTNVLKFLKDLCQQFKLRFQNFRNNYFQGLEIISPQNVLNVQFHQNNPNAMLDLIRKFRIFHRGIENPEVSIINELAELLFRLDLPDDLRQEDINIEDFWFGIYHLPNDQGEFLHRNLAKFILRILMISHSNAEVERWFSAQNNTHTPLRNRLYVTTVNGILLAKQRVQLTGDCRTYQPEEEVVNSYLSMFLNYQENNDV